MSIISLSSKLPTANLANKTVFLRADLNVPIVDNKIVDDSRLQALKPTLDLLKSKECTVIITTHIGRPKSAADGISTKLLLPWFKQEGYSIEFAPTIDDAKKISAQHNNKFILLENLRFFPGEKERDIVFAQQLASLADYYVQDAFGSLHNDDSSMTLVAQQFSPENRTIGLLVEKELSYLNRLLNNPEKPFVCILGGGKGTEKIPVMLNLLPQVNAILLGPAVSTDVAYALQKQVGASTIDPQLSTTINQFLLQAKMHQVTIGLPLDYYITTTGSMNGPLQVALADNVPNNGFIVTIGPATQVWYSKLIMQAKTVFYNGLMGDTALPDTLQGTAALFKAMAKVDGLTVIAGGDTVAAAHLLNCTAAFDYCSTGGGATLAYLAGNKLPGLKPFTSSNCTAIVSRGRTGKK